MLVEEDFDVKRPTGKTYYWLKEFSIIVVVKDTDEWALANGYVSIVPVKYDITSYDFFLN